MKLLRLIFNELYNHPRFTLLFVLNLSLGLSGFIALDVFKNSISHTLKQRSKSVLGADFGISARRPITDNERDTIKSVIGTDKAESHITEMFSMVAGPSEASKLIQIKAIEENYPFYGEMELHNQGIIGASGKSDLHEPSLLAWVYPEILIQLNAKIGDQISIGEAKFTISDVVNYDSAAGLSTNMAPRIYVSQKNIEVTNLIQPGTIAWHSYVYKLPSLQSIALESTRKSIFLKLDDPQLQVYTHENVSETLGRMLSYLNDFLGLTALAALFLAGVGTGFLFRSYLRSKIYEIAILLSLGLSKTKALGLYLFQLVSLGLLSSLLAIAFGLILIPVLQALTKNFLPFPVEFSLHIQTLGLAVLLGTLGSAFICLPLLSQIQSVRPSILLNEGERSKASWSLVTSLALIPGMLGFWGLAVWQAHSLRIGSLFVGLFLGSGLILGLFAWLLFFCLERITKVRMNSLRWAIRDLSRYNLATLSCFLSLGLGILLLNLIPQIQASIAEELRSPEKSKLPSLFLFDIQEDQVEPLKAVVKRNNVVLEEVQAMIRARLLTVNDKAFDKGKGRGEKTLSREEEREMRFRNRGFNLSYRDRMYESETILEGEDFSGPFSGGENDLPGISIETRFADRLGLSLDDILTFDVQSTEVKGIIQNIRKVKWNTFQPNFFVRFQSGVLEAAPKTFLATIPRLSHEKKTSLQNEIVREIPNISIVDISRLIDRLYTISQQMSWALQFMAILCIIAGFVVLYSIASHQAQAREWDIGLFKVLGAKFHEVRALFLWQFGLIAFFASILGLGFSLVVSYSLSSILFDSAWAFDPVVPLATLVASITLTIAITQWAVARALKAPVKELLR